jgi:superfamily II DNA or RNA helicase
MSHLDQYLYPHQIEAIKQKKNKPKCLINMWCGTGKTRTFTVSLFQDNQKLNVIVFPSLGLINQYNNDYFLSQETFMKENFENFDCFAFCSDSDNKLDQENLLNHPSRLKYSTNDDELHQFVNSNHQNQNLLILVTYHSYEKLINYILINKITINRLIYDEAHHIVGENIQNIVFNNDELDLLVDKTEFYTATPVNKNGITMYDSEEPQLSDCGELAYQYLYYQAVEDGYSKEFETNISLYANTLCEKNNCKFQGIYEFIIRTCLQARYNYWNILTYHSYVNHNENVSIKTYSYVKDFSSSKNVEIFKKTFTRIQNDEFPDTKSLFKLENIIFKGVESNTKDKEKIINEFDKKIKGRIYIISSCGILNEGIDTKWANMEVPIDPTQSIVN